MLVVGLDELDSILSEMNLQEKREFIGVLNQLVDTGQKLIVATTSEPSKVEWLKASPLASRSRAIVLCPFLDKDIDTMIDAYLNDCSPEIREKIHEWSGNWPNYAKAILYYLLKIKTYEPDFFDTAIHEAIKVEVDPMGQHLFREHWNDDERRALLLLVLKDVVSDLDLPNVKAHTAFLRLVERGYLLEDAGQYRFRVKLIAEWLRGWSHLKLYIKELHLEEWIRIVEDPWHHKSGEISIPVTQDDLRRRGF
jgi:hypothetical protein